MPRLPESAHGSVMFTVTALGARLPSFASACSMRLLAAANVRALRQPRHRGIARPRYAGVRSDRDLHRVRRVGCGGHARRQPAVEVGDGRRHDDADLGRHAARRRWLGLLELRVRPHDRRGCERRDPERDDLWLRRVEHLARRRRADLPRHRIERVGAAVPRRARTIGVLQACRASTAIVGGAVQVDTVGAAHRAARAVLFAVARCEPTETRFGGGDAERGVGPVDTAQLAGRARLRHAPHAIVTRHDADRIRADVAARARTVAFAAKARLVEIRVGVAAPDKDHDAGKRSHEPNVYHPQTWRRRVFVACSSSTMAPRSASVRTAR
jgi:hypothetical protein